MSTNQKFEVSAGRAGLNNDVWYLVGAVLLAESATGITLISSLLHVYKETQSAWNLGILMAAIAFPGLISGIFAGVLVEKLDYRRSALAASASSGLILLAASGFLDDPAGSLLFLYIALGLLSIFYQVFRFSTLRMLSRATTQIDLNSPNSKMAIGQSASLAGGFLAAGLLLQEYQASNGFLMSAAAFLISALLMLLLQIKMDRVEDAPTLASSLATATAGSQILWSEPPLRIVLVFSIAGGIVIGLWNTALLAFCVRVLDMTNLQYGLIEALALSAYVAGGVVAGRAAAKLQGSQWLAVGYLMAGLCGAALSQIDTAFVAYIAVAGFALFSAPTVIGRTQLLERHTSKNNFTAASNALMVVRDVSLILGMLGAGVADHIPVQDTLLYSALGLCFIGLLAIGLPGMRHTLSDWKTSLELLRGASEGAGVSSGRAVTDEDIEQIKRTFPAFAAVDEEAFGKIRLDFTLVEAEPGMIIVQQGQTSDKAYFILEGSVIVGHVSGSREEILTVLLAGDFFGEIAVLTGGARSANIIVRKSSKLLRISASTLREMIKLPPLYNMMFSTMMDRMMTSPTLDTPRKTAYGPITTSPRARGSSDTFGLLQQLIDM